MTISGNRTILVEVSRSTPGSASRFEVPVTSPSIRVLDALLYIREHIDASLAFRYSCRAGMCGSCACVVNGTEALACQTTLDSLRADIVRVGPLRSLPVLRDLTSDMEPFFDSLRRAGAALDAKDPGRRTLRTMPPGEAQRQFIEQQNGCITCAACFSACGSSNMRPKHLGPAAMNRVLMLALDERDARGMARLETLAQETEALPCDEFGDFTAVCPVDIPLRDGIQKLKALVAGSAIQ